MKRKVLTLRLTKEFDWLFDAIEEEKKNSGRSSNNNVMLNALAYYFNQNKRRSTKTEPKEQQTHIPAGN